MLQFPTRSKKTFFEMCRARLPALLFLLCILLAIFLITWGVVLLCQKSKKTEYFAFRRIQVVMDAQHIKDQQIIQIIKKNLHGGFFSLQVESLRKALLAEPWIANVSFRRVWPDMLEVDVDEQKPLARWGDDYLLNDKGDIFSVPKKTYPERLPLLQGPEHTEELVMLKYERLQQALLPLSLQVSQLSLNDRRSWLFVANDGLLVKLGQADTEERLQRFITIYRDIIANSKIKAASVDLRYSNGVAIQWQDSFSDANMRAK